MSQSFVARQGKCMLSRARSISKMRISIKYLVPSRSSSSYLHKSVIPTMHFQESLPRLPIPKLEDTCQRYLDAQKPFLTPNEYELCKEVTGNFASYEGRALHAKLVEFDKQNTHTSFIYGPWYDMYLKYRDSIVLNHNPYIAMVNDQTTNDQLCRTAKLIYSSVKFKKSLDDGVLEPDVYHLNPKKSDTRLFRELTRLLPRKVSWYGAYMFNAYPLDMSQYARLFNSTRVPKLEKDELLTDRSARHILILKNGHYFVFDVIREDGSILSLNEIYANLRCIEENAKEPARMSLGALTAQKRDLWAAVRQEIIKNPENAKSLNFLETALCAVCLENKECPDDKVGNEMFLYGNPQNRWFDKSLQLIISKNAETAIHFEHSWGDGVAVMRYLNELCTDTAKYTFTPLEGKYESSVRRLDFITSPGLEAAIAEAHQNHEQACALLKYNAVQVKENWKTFFKQQKVSPDAMFQLAIQMAYFRLCGKAAPTYESCSTAAFKHGRTETVRPATVATVACSEAFESSHPAGASEIADLIRKQSALHSKLTKNAATGQGFDRHLFGLKTLAQQLGKEVDFFNDQFYKNINHIILSTSTVFSPNVKLGGFAPVTSNGLGIGYMLNDDWIGCNVTSYPDSPSGADFVELISDSLHDIHSVLSGTFKKNK